MKLSQYINFIAAGLLVFFILKLIPFRGDKVALRRWEQVLRMDRALIEQVTTRCGTLTSINQSSDERFFIQKFSPLTKAAAETTCKFQITKTESSQFGLISRIAYGLQIFQDENLDFFIDRVSIVQMPKPLCFFPIALFLLGLVFGVPTWNLVWTLSAYVFFLSGANFLQALDLILQSAILTLTTDKTLPGLSLIVIWLAVLQNKAVPDAFSLKPATKIETNLNRLLTGLIGLWNPAFFTLIGRVFFPVQTGLKKMRPFLDGQLFVAMLSVYVFSIDVREMKDFLERSLFLPRYFSFAAFLFLILNYGYKRPRKQVMLLDLPNIKRNLFFILTLEAIGFVVPTLRIFPTLTRVGIALLLSELSALPTLRWKMFAHSIAKPISLLFLASFLSVISLESGLIDLALVLWEPQTHPSVLVIFTFMAGMALGFVTGSFSTTFFALFHVLMKSYHLPLVQAALLDGIIAGSLLSPFSIFNLIPAVNFGVNLQELVAFRFRQLAVPILIGAIIYTVSAVNSVAILRPVTFVFLCLVVIGVQLRRVGYRLPRFFPNDTDTSLQVRHSG